MALTLVFECVHGVSLLDDACRACDPTVDIEPARWPSMVVDELLDDHEDAEIPMESVGDLPSAEEIAETLHSAAYVIPSIAPDLGPVPSVVGMVEQLLARVKSGDVRAVAIATVDRGLDLSTAIDCGDVGSRSPLYMCVGHLAQRLLEGE